MNKDTSRQVYYIILTVGAGNVNVIILAKHICDQDSDQLQVVVYLDTQYLQYLLWKQILGIIHLLASSQTEYPIIDLILVQGWPI